MRNTIENMHLSNGSLEIQLIMTARLLNSQLEGAAV